MGVFSVDSAVNKRVLASFGGLMLMVFSVSHAGMNPFKKSKNYVFGPDISWYEHNDTAVKSGSVRDGENTNYYHLNIDNDQLLLRLGRNDPSGELENTRLLENLSIVEVSVDGRPMPLFNWCLRNQQNPGKKLKQNAIVANGTCVNAGGGGDFIINLDSGTSKLLYSAKMLEFVVEPYGRGVKLSYSMLGYAPVMDVINKPVPLPKVKKSTPKPVAVVAKPKPKAKVKPKVRPKPKAKPKPVKNCYAKPPGEYKSQISTLSYPCNDNKKKASAESKISARVKQEKESQKAEANAEREMRQRAREDTKREAEWDSRQSNLWISRCKKHWSKNSSPCYCEKYLSQAPAGVKNTCGK